MQIFKPLTTASGMLLVHFNSSLDINNTIQNYFFKQIDMLKTTTTIRVDNLFGITKELDDTINSTITTILDLFYEKN